MYKGQVPSRDNMDFDLGGQILADGVRAVDAGDLPWDAEQPEANRETIRSAIGAILDAGAVPITIGCDDSIPIPVFLSLIPFSQPTRPY